MTQPGPDDQSPAHPGQPALWVQPPGPAAPAEPTWAAQLPPVPQAAPVGPPPPGPPAGWVPQGQPYAQWGAGQYGQQYGQWGPGQPPVNPAVTRGRKKWPAIVGGLVVLAGLGTAGALFADAAQPEVGDCISPTGDSFDVVDCDSSDAHFTITGKQAGQQTYETFQTDPDTCAAFPGTEFAAWYGTDGEKGDVYCAGPIAGS